MDEVSSRAVPFDWIATIGSVNWTTAVGTVDRVLTRDSGVGAAKRPWTEKRNALLRTLGRKRLRYDVDV